MLYVFGFDKIAVLVSDLYFDDPEPFPGQEGPEQGARIEVREILAEPLHGNIYSAQPISVGQPIWRGDFLETVSQPGTFNRTHHHPRFTGWDPGGRHYEKELSLDPLGWVEATFSDVSGLLTDAGVDVDDVAGDVDRIRTAAPQIVDALRQSLELARSGDRHPDGPLPAEANGRVGWI